MMSLNLTNANASLSPHAIRNSNAASVPSASFLRKQSCFRIGVAPDGNDCLSNGRIQVCWAGLCGGVRFIWVFMYVAQGETDGVKIMLLS